MEKNNKRRTLPPFPENYVTLLHLQERRNKTKQEIQDNEQQQLEPKPEAEPKPHEQGRIGDVRKKSEVVDVRLSIRETADKMIESDGVKTAKRKWQSKRSKKSKSETRAREAAGAAEDVEEVAAGEARAPQTKEASVELRNGGRSTKMSTDGGRDKGKEGPETKPEGAVCLVGCQITDKKGETWKSKKNLWKKEWKKRDEEEVAGKKEGPEKKADTDKKGEYWKSKKYKGKRERKKTEEKKNEEEVGGGNAHAKKASDEKEESEKPEIAVVAADQTVEIEGWFKDMSIKGGGERGNDQPARSNNGGRYRGGNRMFDNGRRHEESKPRYTGMIWVKKGDTSGGNAICLNGSG
ncbi:hypothetical protein Ddye_006652 [Dipteronia dyeriana]|uniref:Uncharacterized protein n=1 Tax=Dipteronia dyeriana TaxID=168575 RepID=A0AAD9XIK3_9ROSI|nr:hypothetical protein Ddye_006652 [Dipteronia dyeriana]